jgi:hypothetical protein
MAILTYVSKEQQRLANLKKGMEANNADWTAAGENPTDVQKHWDDLENADKEISLADVKLQNLRIDAKALVKTKADAADKLVLKVKAKYADDPKKWADFGIANDTTTAARATSNIPAKGVIKSIKNDDDGVGFVVEGETVANANFYEWQRAEGKADDENATTPMMHLRSVRKTKIVDDDVKSGVRYFYRYRGVNAQGVGDWSEVISGVQ